MLPDKYQHYRELLTLWGDTKTPKQFLQAFLRRVISVDFNVNRIGIFKIIENEVRFLFGIGPELPAPQNIYDLDMHALSQDGELIIPTEGIGFDYFVRIDRFVFGFDDIHTNRTFNKDDREGLKEISKFLVTLLVTKIEDAQVRHAAEFDELTGLPRRHKGFETLGKKIEEIQNTNDPGMTLAVGIMDVDLFKRTNDTVGHEAGDTVLCHIAKLASKIVLDGHGHISRMGGEEFLIVADNPDVMEEVRIAIENTPVEYNQFLLVKSTVSIGIVRLTPDGLLPKMGITDICSTAKRMADRMLYMAKEMGRNNCLCVEFHDDTGTNNETIEETDPEDK